MLRPLLVLLLAWSAFAQDAAPQVVAADNLPWRAPVVGEHAPTFGLATGKARYLEILAPRHDPPEEAPAADELPWAKHDLLLATWGTKPTGGYAIAATAVKTEPERVTVTLRLTAPGPDAMVTQALTHPATLVPIPKRPELVVRLTGDRAPAGSADFPATSGGGFTVIDDRPAR